MLQHITPFRRFQRRFAEIRSVLFIVSLVCFVVRSSSVAFSADPEAPAGFEWAISAGGTQHDKTRGIAVDPEGNVLLTGEFTGTAKFGEHSLAAVGSMDFFVAKVSPEGKFLWVHSGGGDKIDRGYAIATDHLGNCYVTGHYESAAAKFDEITIESVGDYDLFVAKYDSAGKLQWLQGGGGKGYDYGHGIAADKLGNVFVTGAVVGEGKYLGEPVGHSGPAHVFCLSLNSNGRLNWSRSAVGESSSTGHGIAVDQQGNCYVGGNCNGKQTLGGRQTIGSGTDILVAKFDTQGNVVWLHDGHGSSNAMIHEITADSAGNVWAAGMFRGDLKLADRTVTNQGQHDLLLTSFDPSGKRLWTKTAGGVGIDYGLGVAADERGNSYLTGSFTGRVDFDGVARQSSTPASDIMIVKYDRDGALRAFQQAGSNGTDHAYTIVTDQRGNLYLSGACSSAAKFGPHSLPHLGSNDIFLAKLRLENAEAK